MSELIFRGALPSSGEFRQALAQALSATNPVDDLLELSDRLREYEQKYKLPSPDFYQSYQAGTLDDELQHCIEWAAAYDLFIRTTRPFRLTDTWGIRSSKLMRLT